MNGAASLERWNCPGWKLNTATNCCYGSKEKLARERLNLEEELAVEAYPTFVVDERGRPTCTSLNFVNSCDRSTVWRNFLEYQRQVNERCLFFVPNGWKVSFHRPAGQLFWLLSARIGRFGFCREATPCTAGGFSTPSVVVYGQKERGSWGFRFFRTVAFELEISDWALLCSRGKCFRIKMSLVWTFQSLASLAPSFCQPNQDFSACFRINLQLQIAPAKFPAFVPGSESKVEWKEPP